MLRRRADRRSGRTWWLESSGPFFRGAPPPSRPADPTRHLLRWQGWVWRRSVAWYRRRHAQHCERF